MTGRIIDYPIDHQNIGSLANMSLTKIRKINLHNLDMLNKFHEVMEEEHAESLRITDTGEVFHKTWEGEVLCWYYRRGLADNLSGMELLKFVRKHAGRVQREAKRIIEQNTH